MKKDQGENEIFGGQRVSQPSSPQFAEEEPGISHLLKISPENVKKSMGL